jgi:hypothetical protein
MEKQASVILLEFNELTPSLVDAFIGKGQLPNFKHLRDQSRVFVTDAQEDPAPEKRLLNPWVQWVTVHTGVGAAAHGVRKLGEAAKLRQPSLTELLTDAGRRVLIFGTMNVRYGRGVDGCVLPDPWTTDTEPHPKELAPFYRFIQKSVQDHTGDQDALSAVEYVAFLRFMLTHGLSASTVLAIARQLVAERTGKYGWKRVAILDRLQWDVFRHYYRRLRPHFSTFFLNSTAHLQHKFWRNMDPEAFTIKPSAQEQPELRNAVLFGYQQMDHLLGRFMRLAGSDTTLILCTALSQQPCLLYEHSGGKTFYRAHNIERVVEFAGVRERYTYAPVMSEEFHLTFDAEAAASAAAARLSALNVGGEAALAIIQEGARLTAGCGIFKQLPAGAVLESGAAESRIPFFDLFYQGGGIKSGMHHPDGMLWIRLPDRSHAVETEKVGLRSVAPTILQLLGLRPPFSMEDGPLFGPKQERVEEQTVPAAMRRVS